jgi:hypothetical protein
MVYGLCFTSVNIYPIYRPKTPMEAINAPDRSQMEDTTEAQPSREPKNNHDQTTKDVSNIPKRKTVKPAKKMKSSDRLEKEKSPSR